MSTYQYLHVLTRPDVLGSAAFKPVKNDMAGNIKVLILYSITIFGI
jgi:hypothetical protein